jgi:energy-coupling factor transporter ATP-binding protein EcfA2
MTEKAKPSRDAVMFRVVNTRHQVDPDPAVVVLERDLWDDFGIKSSFRVFTASKGEHELLGTWKIIDRKVDGPRLTELPREFEQLQTRFVSLAQDRDTYVRVTQLDRSLALAILKGLRDEVFRPSSGVEKVEAFNTSLVRFVAARDALRSGAPILAAAGILQEDNALVAERLPDILDLSVSAMLVGFRSPHSVKLHFSRQPQTLGVRRTIVLVGPNGSGKTQLLGVLARALSGLDRRGVHVTPDRPFRRVLAVSYGAFDHFTTPRRRHKESSYIYCGLRVAEKESAKREESHTKIDMEGALIQAAHDIAELARGPRQEAWQQALKCVRLGALDDQRFTSPREIVSFLKHELSAGQKVVVLTLANLATFLETNSVVLHDEPETHLHPNLLSAMLRAVHGLLDHFDSYAVVATHSLIPLQETPASNVFVLERSDEAVVSISQPVQQCFAATLDEISRVTFRAEPDDENFRSVLRNLRQHYSVDEIRQFLGGQLSLGAQMLLASLKQ